MTYHVSFKHECPNCGAYYIPFDRDVPCPRCGELEEKRFDFIPRAAQSAHYNLTSRGGYVPSAWYVGSLGDHILHILFQVLDFHRKDTTGRPFSDVARDALSRMEWGDQLYLRDHIHAIACRVRDNLDQAGYGTHRGS